MVPNRRSIAPCQIQRGVICQELLFLNHPAQLFLMVKEKQDQPRNILTASVCHALPRESAAIENQMREGIGVLTETAIRREDSIDVRGLQLEAFPGYREAPLCLEFVFGSDFLGAGGGADLLLDCNFIVAIF